MHTTRLPKSTFSIAARLFLPVLVLGGCSTFEKQTRTYIDGADSVLERSRQAGAETYAPETMASADNYLKLAKKAIAAGKLDDARRFAEKAAADGELAQATGDSVRVQRNLESLRRQLAELSD